MRRSIFYYGILGASILVGLNFVYFLLFGVVSDFFLGEVVGYSAIVLSLSLIFFGIKSYRDRQARGQLSFAKAFATGVGIALIPSLAFAIYNYIYFTILDPGFVEKYFEYSKKSIRESGAPEHEIEAKLLAVDQMMADPFQSSELFQAAVMFATVFLIGVVISLVSSVILKTSKNSGV